MTLIIEPPVEPAATPLPGPEVAPSLEDATRVKELVIVNWSGDLDKVWPVLILSSTAAASGLRCRVFVTFWGLLPFAMRPPGRGSTGLRRDVPAGVCLLADARP